MLSEEKLNELCAKELLELDRHTYGYATAGKDINAVLDRYSTAYKTGYRAAERDAQELVEALEYIVKGCPTGHPECTCCRSMAIISLTKWRERVV